MNEPQIFISVGGTCNDKQESFVSAIENRLRSENLIPNTVGRNKFGSESPLKTVMDLMDECSGTIIIALERTYFPTGFERRGGAKETKIEEIKFPTPWNQIEASLSYSKGLPLLFIIEEGLRSEGMLEKGYDWYVMWVKPDTSFLTTVEFNGVLSSWKKKVENYKTKSKANEKIIDPSTLTMGDIFKNLKVSHFWGIVTILIGLIIGSFWFGHYVSEKELLKKNDDQKIKKENMGTPG